MGLGLFRRIVELCGDLGGDFAGQRTRDDGVHEARERGRGPGPGFAIGSRVPQGFHQAQAFFAAIQVTLIALPPAPQLLDRIGGRVAVGGKGFAQLLDGIRPRAAAHRPELALGQAQAPAPEG